VPELPEVETVVRDLRPRLIGRRFSSITIGPRSLRKPWSKKWNSRLLQHTVSSIRRRGKWIIVEFTSGAHLVVHLGMTGQLTVCKAGQEMADHTHIVVKLDKGAEQLRFRDVRRFGSATVYETAGELNSYFERSGLGPEPFDVGANYWSHCLGKTERCLKAVLLDQRVVAGVGNIYADESLFRARLHPARLASETNEAERARLRRAIIRVLTFAIEKRGSSIRDYIGGSGLKGEFQQEFQVYGLTGEPCPRCRRPIECVRLAGRSSHHCPRCQPMKRR
jgi:formamidopyrimidine-DNA glycosylase